MSDEKKGGPANQDVSGTDSSLVAGPDLDAGMPAVIADLAAACHRFVATRYGVPLDFTPETLSLVDQYVRDARTELSTRPEGLELVAGTIGAYLGEVIRRAEGGHWRADGEPSSFRVMLRHVFLSFNPIGMAREALTGEEAEGYGAHLALDDGDREAVEARLNALPEVDADEYALPTTRAEVVQIAAAAIRSHMEANGLGDVTFAPEDYD